MDSLEFGLAENAPNESEANPAPTCQPTNAYCPEEVTSNQPKPPPRAAADEQRPRTQTIASTKLRNFLEKIRETTVLQNKQLPPLESSITEFFKYQQVKQRLKKSRRALCHARSEMNDWF